MASPLLNGLGIKWDLLEVYQVLWLQSRQKGLRQVSYKPFNHSDQTLYSGQWLFNLGSNTYYIHYYISDFTRAPDPVTSPRTFFASRTFSWPQVSVNTRNAPWQLPCKPPSGPAGENANIVLVIKGKSPVCTSREALASIFSAAPVHKK